MEDNFDQLEQGMKNLFTRTLLVIYTGLLAFAGGKAHAATSILGSSVPLDEDFVTRLRRMKYKPQLVLKLNMANLAASKASMHTSHRSHSSHSSHYSSSGGGHSSHSSHSSHYSSSSYTPSSGSGSTPSYSSPAPSYSSPSPSISGGGSIYSQPLTSSYALGDRILKLGDRGPDVVVLQQLLIAVGYEVTATGSFGLATNAAVKDFQARHSLPADGIVGAQTVRALQK